jgi:Tfp pilus assembly protein FimT
MIAVVTVICVVAGIAVPVMKNMTEGMRLGQSAREVEREIQTARLRAVTSNRAIRLRFNCPTAGQYRMVELLGTPTNNSAADAAANRCQESVYPPTPDNNPLTIPNQDGPLRRLHPTVAFGATQPLEFWPDGTVHSDPTGASPPKGSSWPVLGTTGTAITLTKGSYTKRITVNGLGKVQLQ